MDRKIYLHLAILLFAVINTEGQSSNNSDETNVISSSTNAPVQSTTPTRDPWIKYPCSCGKGQCGCCTGNVLPIPQRACTNITYNPEDFLFNIKMYFNERLLYQTTMSGKDPRPICVPVRVIGLKFCARLSNVYMVGRNVHACLNLDGYWGSTDLYHVNFNCFRIGSNGMAIVKPEDGGGLPPPPEQAPLKPGDEDYDDTARR